VRWTDAGAGARAGAGKNTTQKNKKNFFRLFLGGKSFQLPQKRVVFQTLAVKMDLIFGKSEKISG
jgi:hypothetical protein